MRGLRLTRVRFGEPWPALMSLIGPLLSTWAVVERVVELVARNGNPLPRTRAAPCPLLIGRRKFWGGKTVSFLLRWVGAMRLAWMCGVPLAKLRLRS